MKLFLAVFLFLFSTSSFSAVNMRNGSYTEKWVDFIEPGKGFDMRIERFYSSRSLFIGLFGFGWCSNIETHLTITSDGILNLTECGGGLEVTYYPEIFESLNAKETTQKVIKRLSRDKAMTQSALGNLANQLMKNTKLRFEYANRFGFVDTTKFKSGKNTFLAKTKGFERITFNGKFYERRRLDGYIEKFNRQGQLVQISNPMGLWIKINYKGQKIHYVVDKKGRRLNFIYDRAGRLASISNARKLITKYTFEGENLVEVTNMWSKTYRFQYESNHNLIKVDFPDNTAITMSYDNEKDWIKSYTNRLGCKESFSFQTSKNDPQNHYWGDFSRKCPKGRKVSGRHEFWYKPYPMSKDKYLDRVKETYGRQFKDLYLHPYLGKPISLNENRRYQGFSYKSNGLLNKKEDKNYTAKRKVQSWEKTDFYYKSSPWVNRTLTSILNASGKVKKEVSRTYKYNNSGLLRKVYNTENFVKLQYNENSRLSRLENKNKTKIKLSYAIGSEKPNKIEQVNLGSLEISYDSEGRVTKVKSNSKRNVSSSIIESFLEMVDFVGPLGEDLKL